MTTAAGERPAIGYGVLALLVLGTTLGGLLQNAVSTVLPAIMAETGAAVGTAQWLVTVFQLCLGVTTPLVAFLSRRYSVRRLYLASMLAFTAGTFLVAAAPGFWAVFAGRVLEGIGAGIAFPLIQVIVFQNFPRDRWATIMGFCGLAFGFAPNIGPTIAGACTDCWGWRSMFWGVAVMLAVLTLVTAAVLVRNGPRDNSHGDPRSIDTVSVALSTLGFGGLLLGLANTTNLGPGSAECLVPLAVGVLSIAAFLTRQPRIGNPLWDLGAFRNRDFAAGTAMVCLLFSAFMAVTLVLPLGMEEAQGFTALEAGLALLPGTVAALVMNPLSGVLMDRVGVRPVICVAGALLVAGTIPFLQLAEMDDLAQIMTFQGIRAFGISSLIQPLSTWSVRSLAPSLVADGTSISNTLRQVAAALGTSASVLLMSWGAAPGSVSAFGVDVAIAFSLACSLGLLVLALAFVREATAHGATAGRP